MKSVIEGGTAPGFGAVHSHSCPSKLGLCSPDQDTTTRDEVPGGLRYLTFSCYGHRPLFKNDVIKDLFAQRLDRLRARLKYKLRAWVIMPDHVHLMLVPPENMTVRRLLGILKGPFAQRVIARWIELDAAILRKLLHNDGKYRFWETGGGHDRNIFTGEEHSEKLNYIHMNPVAAGLVKMPTDWAWSSARWYAGMREGAIPIDA